MSSVVIQKLMLFPLYHLQFCSADRYRIAQVADNYVNARLLILTSLG